jgi:two-component system response regulator HydG
MARDAALLSDVVIVVADPDPGTATTLRQRFEAVEPGVRVEGVRRLDRALAALDQERVGCVVTELRLADAVGVDVVRALRVAAPAIPVVVWTCNGSEDIAVTAMRLGVADYQRKDSGVAALSAAVREALGSVVLRAVATAPSGGAREAPTPVRPFGGTNLVATSDAMHRVLELVDQAATSTAPVLLEGETGTGKELLAKAIHVRGARRDEPLLVQNCAALSETLLESELFGHVRGAYTGAERDRRGLFLEAGSGSVFLDEIGEAPHTVQAKLLRVLQHREIKPVGADRVQPMRARVIAATNRNLADEVAAGRFRADLYYRLNVLPIRIPPLRHRVSDIPHLLAYFREMFERAECRTTGGFTVDAVRGFEGYPWPGNIRELEHEVHRLVLTVPEGMPIRSIDLKPAIRAATRARDRERLDTLLARVELAVINDRLRWLPTKAAAARSLGITREALYLKLKRLAGDSDTDGVRVRPDFHAADLVSEGTPGRTSSARRV